MNQVAKVIWIGIEIQYKDKAIKSYVEILIINIDSDSTRIKILDIQRKVTIEYKI